MHLLVKTTAVLTLLGAANIASAQCEYPQKDPVPNGITASEQDMLDGQRSVKTFMAAMDEYLACIEEDAKVAVSAEEDPEAQQQQQSIATKKHNAAVEDMEKLAASFNEQVRTYKNRDK